MTRSDSDSYQVKVTRGEDGETYISLEGLIKFFDYVSLVHPEMDLAIETLEKMKQKFLVIEAQEDLKEARKNGLEH